MVYSAWPAEEHEMVNSKHSHTHCVENEAKHVEKPATMGSTTLFYVLILNSCLVTLLASSWHSKSASTFESVNPYGC